MRRASALLALLLVEPATAAERTLTITDFDRLRVDGGFTVDVVTGRGTSARVSGTPEAIDATLVEVQGRTLSIRRNRVNWSGNAGRTAAPATVRVIVPVLTGAFISGPATVRIDRMKGMRVSVSLEGTGKLSVASVTTDRLDLGMLGSGRVEIAGEVAGMTSLLRGAVELDAAKLTIADLKLTSENAGAATLFVVRAANVTATGSGSVVVLGRPACTVRNIGSGTVMCGASKQAEVR